LGDSGEHLDAIREGAIGCHQRVEGIDDLHASKLDRPYFDNLVAMGVKPCGLEVKGNAGLVHEWFTPH
jgi:hypothetical protein